MDTRLPCAVCLSRGTVLQNLGRSASRECVLMFEIRKPSLRAKRSNPFRRRKNGLLRRGACHRARIRATRWLLAMTVSELAVLKIEPVTIHCVQKASPYASSLRKQGPITTIVCCSGSRQPPCQNARPRRMGPCFRRDDDEKSLPRLRCLQRVGWVGKRYPSCSERR
jgi:hypothetical protein